MNKKMLILGVIVVAVVVIVGGIFLNQQKKTPTVSLDTFAQCLKDKGATFYGAFWCPHCQNEKKLFGDSAKLLPYVECSTSDGNGQLPICTEKKIQGYPTWIFADGSTQSGEISLAVLAQKTGCQLSN